MQNFKIVTYFLRLKQLKILNSLLHYFDSMIRKRKFQDKLFFKYLI